MILVDVGRVSRKVMSFLDIFLVVMVCWIVYWREIWGRFLWVRFISGVGIF